MKILIIEDEPLVARDLITLVRRLKPDATVLGPLSSVQASQAWLNSNPNPDLILSDIQLSDGTSFEIFEGLQFSFPIIFTTAYDAYAIRAFKLNSIDYLLKPIDAKELESALAKYTSLVQGSARSDQLQELVSRWAEPQKKYKDRFLAVHRNALVPVVVSDIAFFHKEELIYLHKRSQEKLISEHATLDEIESLVNPEHFFRINRQYLVHSHSVGKIRTTHKGLSVQLVSPFNVELDVSREKAVAFKKWLEGA